MKALAGLGCRAGRTDGHSLVVALLHGAQFIAGAIAQIVIVVADLLLTLSFSGMLNRTPNAGSFLRAVVGLGLAIAILAHLSKPETKQWKDSMS